MSDESFISIQNVSKHFGDVHAVDQVSIDIAKGEFFSLLGPSGCGKTTLLRMLAGFEFPTKGEIFIDGQAMSSVTPNHRPVNMVFQNYAIFPHLNVKKNIGFSLRQDKLPKAEFDARVGELLDLIKLPGYEERASHELSGGERQRVALARALIRRPKVLLLDEPLGALDKKLREEMQLELRALQQSVGITFIFVTHDQEEALTMSDRIAVMSEGRVRQVAGPRELYERPNSVEVADFIGQMNFLEATVEEVAGGMAVIEAAGLGRVRTPAGEPFVQPGARVVAAIRPEKLHLSTDGKDGAGNSLRGEVRAAAYLGDRSHYYVHVEGRDQPFAVAAQNVEQEVEGEAERNRLVWLTWADEAVILLPPD